MKNLVIPLKAFYIHEGDGCHPSPPVITNLETNEVRLECGCGQEIKGILKEEMLTVTELDMTGEGPATFYSWILGAALIESMGTLEVVLVWEGGDSITRLQVKDGTVETGDVEL